MDINGKSIAQRDDDNPSKPLCINPHIILYQSLYHLSKKQANQRPTPFTLWILMARQKVHVRQTDTHYLWITPHHTNQSLSFGPKTGKTISYMCSKQERRTPTWC